MSLPGNTPARRPGWLKTLHQWHWISAALCLMGMLLFAATGITLNHAADIGSTPEVSRRQLELAADLRPLLLPAADEARQAPLPPALAGWAATTLGIDAAGKDAEWTAEEIYLPLPRPGGDAWLRIDRESGEAEYEVTDRGWISYLNDLHKGRHTGSAWRWFIDIFSAACLVFSLSGLLILQYHAGNRPSTWPLVGLGALVPLLLALLLVH